MKEQKYGRLQVNEETRQCGGAVREREREGLSGLRTKRKMCKF